MPKRNDGMCKFFKSVRAYIAITLTTTYVIMAVWGMWMGNGVSHESIERIVFLVVGFYFGQRGHKDGDKNGNDTTKEPSVGDSAVYINGQPVANDR